MGDWREDFERRIISAEQAASFVKSGDQVVFTAGREAHAVGLALAARLGEIKGVKVFAPTPGYDFGWYDEGWQESFDVTVLMPTGTSQAAVDHHLCDYNFGTVVPFEMEEVANTDVLLTEVSPPNEKGFCSFGQSLWNKRRHIEQARLVIAEINDNLMWTYGDNYVHFSEIDCFVKHVTSGAEPASGSLAGRKKKAPEPYLRDIVRNVSGLIRDGDCLQIGVGRTTEPLVNLGLFDGKKNLGWHSEATPTGVISLIKEGVINGLCKTVNPGKAVVTSLGGGSRDEMAWANKNPLFRMVDIAYLEDIRVVGAHDNFVALNNALAVDLTGQIAAEGIGHRQISAAGGQIAFAFGAILSRGGRVIHVLPSTAQVNGKTISRIMMDFPEGTPVTMLRNCAMYVVTEYGVADLWGKSVRQRVEQLISVAHPDFREGLWRAARDLYWPREPSSG